MQGEEIFQTIPLSTIQSRRSEKKAKKKKHVNLVPKPTYLSNPKTLKAFPETFPTKMKPTKRPWQKKKKKMRQEKRKKKNGRRESEKKKWRLPCHFWTLSKFCFLRMLEPSLRSVNGFVVRFSSLSPDGDQKTAQTNFKTLLRQNFLRANGLNTARGFNLWYNFIYLSRR